jgi:1-acyl-sn-glycerol-3-phosphate acyltransferase
MSWFYYVGRVIARLILVLFTRFEVKGKENVPRHGAVLVSANHLNLADPPVLAMSLGRVCIFMAKEELFRSAFSRYFVSRFGAFPVHRARLDREALRQAESVLSKGRALIMFPEGGRSDGRLQSAFTGAALIARRAGVPVLPVGITGTDKMRGTGWIFRRPRITVNIGIPFRLPASTGKTRRAELVEHTNTIMERIAGLLPAEYRGHYARPQE